METKMQFTPERLICCDCKQPYVFSAGEQTFFWIKGLSHSKRCKACSDKQKATLVQEPEVRNG